MLGPDSAGTVLGELVRSARHSIDVAMFEVGPSYAWMLAAAARRGVRVRLLIDAHRGDGNRGTAAALQPSGAACRVAGDGVTTFHPKLLLIDGHQVAAGTGNLIWRDAPRDRRGLLPPAAAPLRGTREWWVAVHGSPRLSDAARQAFEAAWSASRPPPASWRVERPEPEAARVGAPAPQVPPLRLHVPDRRVGMVWGGAAILAWQLSAIAGARRRALVTVPYVRAAAPQVATLLSELGRAGGRGLSALLLGALPEPRDAAHLAGTTLAVRVMDPRRSTRGHAKGVVLDDTVLVSSANWSRPGLGVNTEAAVWLRDGDAAAYFAAAFGRDWTVSRRLPEFGAGTPGERFARHELV